MVPENVLCMGKYPLYSLKLYAPFINWKKM